jgi:chemotaxis methyl-accepting protein methylase
MPLPDPAQERLYLEAENRLGIKADEGALAKFQDYLIKTYGSTYEGQAASPALLDRVFASGEAARFLTINETYFFREPAHFSLIRDLLPDFQQSLSSVNPPLLRICSAAASSGCEAYSIAMILEQYNAFHTPLDYHIDAFDLNPDVIAKAQRGVYSKNTLREDGSSYRYLMDRWLKQDNSPEEIPGEELELNPALKEHIRFFQHNIMEALPENSYHITFFRNAFIYFSPRSRIKVLSNLTSSLREGGILIMGVSETSGMNYPQLDELVRGDVFYFRKPFPDGTIGAAVRAGPAGGACPPPEKPAAPAVSARQPVQIDPPELAAIMVDEEKCAAIAWDILKTLEDSREGDSLSRRGNELAASALFLLSRGDFAGASPLLDFIEDRNASAPVEFLRGEYFYLQGMFTEAEFHYKLSLGKNNAFWPSFYRLSSLASGEVLHRHRVKQALESLDRGRDLRYEVFIGGFSPDYYQGALIKQDAG